MVELKCPICGKVFAPKRKDCRCCSTECTIKLYRQERRKIHKKICDVCGCEFETTDKRRKYCCELCAENARKEKSLACYHRVKAEYESRICEQCGAEFQPKTKRSRFCSKKCASIHNQAMALKKPAKLRKCAMCGDDFAPNSSSQKYCGEKCRTKAQIESRKSVRIISEGAESRPKKIMANSPAAVRWAKMSLREISAECARFHLTYGQAQVLAAQGALPEDFGL